MHKQSAKLQTGAYGECPVLKMSESARGKCIEKIVYNVEQMLHLTRYVPLPGSLIQSHQSKCDFVLDLTRIEVKSSCMQWDDGNFRWRVRFQRVRFDYFDRLLLALHTPEGIHIFQHAARAGASTSGKSTSVTGSIIQFAGPVREESWSIALASILSKLKAKGCEHLAFVDRSL